MGVNGMGIATKEELNEFLRSGEEYHRGMDNSGLLRRWKVEVKRRDGWRCVKCGSRKDLTAHHILPYSKYLHSRLDLDNGATLCRKCHCYFNENYGSNSGRAGFNRFMYGKPILPAEDRKFIHRARRILYKFRRQDLDVMVFPHELVRAMKSRLGTCCPICGRLMVFDYPKQRPDGIRVEVVDPSRPVDLFNLRFLCVGCKREQNESLMAYKANGKVKV